MVLDGGAQIQFALGLGAFILNAEHLSTSKHPLQCTSFFDSYTGFLGTLKMMEVYGLLLLAADPKHGYRCNKACSCGLQPRLSLRSLHP